MIRIHSTKPALRKEGRVFPFPCAGSARNIHPPRLQIRNDKCGGWRGTEQMLTFHLCKRWFVRKTRGIDGAEVAGSSSFCTRITPWAVIPLPLKSKDSCDCVEGEHCRRWNPCFVEQSFFSAASFAPKHPHQHLCRIVWRWQAARLHTTAANWVKSWNGVEGKERVTL